MKTYKQPCELSPEVNVGTHSFERLNGEKGAKALSQSRWF